MTREEDVNLFYSILQRLKERKCGSFRELGECDSDMKWPERGVYFLCAPDETREDSSQLRVTHVGTHMLSQGTDTTLWDSLRKIRGATTGDYAGGGNHRNSALRRLVGEAIIERDGLEERYPDWNSSAETGTRDEEHELEEKVSEFLGELQVLWMEVDDRPSSKSERGVIQRNAVALLSNLGTEYNIDERPGEWLGNYSPGEKVRDSGLWNVKHVDEEYDPEFLDIMENRVE